MALQIGRSGRLHLKSVECPSSSEEARIRAGTSNYSLRPHKCMVRVLSKRKEALFGYLSFRLYDP